MVLWRRSQDLLAERAQVREGTRGWDLVLAPIVALAGPLAMCAVAGLDRRYGWTPPAAPAVLAAGLAVVVLGSWLTTWAMAPNPFWAVRFRLLPRVW